MNANRLFPGKQREVNFTITGGDINGSISVGECVGGEGAGRGGMLGNNVKHPPFLSFVLISL